MNIEDLPPGTPALKDSSVRIQGMRVELLFALLAASRIWAELGYALVITSLNDGRHSWTSLHYSGSAADLRIRHMRTGDAARATEELQAALGIDFDVVLEEDHIHVEYQPKRRGLEG